MHRNAVCFLCFWIALACADQVEISADTAGTRDQNESRTEIKRDGLAPYGSFQKEGTFQSGGELGYYIQNVAIGLSKGLSFVGRFASTTGRAISRFSGYVITSATKTVLIQGSMNYMKCVRNKTARDETFASARKVMLAIYSKTPHVLNSTATFLDTSAQFSLEVTAPLS